MRNKFFNIALVLSASLILGIPLIVVISLCAQTRLWSGTTMILAMGLFALAFWEVVWARVRGLQISIELRRRGYMGIDFLQGTKLWAKYGKKLYRIPAWEHTAVIPGFRYKSFEDIEYLVAILELVDSTNGDI